MPPTFYFALGARARPHDLVIALHVGQRHYLVPAGSSTERLLARTPGVHVVLDSGAFPPGNTARLSLPHYAHRVSIADRPIADSRYRDPQASGIRRLILIVLPLAQR
ncbi:hypothetical protein [Candidatus Viridilinea mediisalina]|uniref:Uncharacterized protein n=1 Tax=Candidatus Viridilinea mediisalina TaxID=2024553 RepID=A0A2A6RQB1_9CHLR|nr:hypothetical protein [Candidatus Viridilinea mediisalina]PDW05120.1 hypothetical protein CJ255_00575 [Candidatus Viridilinea mediisalina]